jgi:hypothetical protein
MRWKLGFSASEIASTAFSNPKIFRARGTPPSRLRLIFRDIGRSHVCFKKGHLLGKKGHPAWLRQCPKVKVILWGQNWIFDTFN